MVVAGRKVSPAWEDIPIRILSPINIRSTLGVSEDPLVHQRNESQRQAPQSALSQN
jgi:hypothetical protein